MDEMQPQMNLDLSKTTPILTPSGDKIWAQGYILRKVSKFVTGTSDDNVLPIQVFYDPQTGEILKEGLPAELKFMVEENEN
mgnify:CR=1 FL=1|jgi:hypothetical protein